MSLYWLFGDSVNVPCHATKTLILSVVLAEIVASELAVRQSLL
jgi:hypothetical protein